MTADALRARRDQLVTEQRRLERSLMVVTGQVAECDFWLGQDESGAEPEKETTDVGHA